MDRHLIGGMADKHAKPAQFHRARVFVSLFQIQTLLNLKSQQILHRIHFVVNIKSQERRTNIGSPPA